MSLLAERISIFPLGYKHFAPTERCHGLQGCRSCGAKTDIDLGARAIAKTRTSTPPDLRVREALATKRRMGDWRFSVASQRRRRSDD